MMDHWPHHKICLFSIKLICLNDGSVTIKLRLDIFIILHKSWKILTLIIVSVKSKARDRKVLQISFISPPFNGVDKMLKQTTKKNCNPHSILK